MIEVPIAGVLIAAPLAVLVLGVVHAIRGKRNSMPDTGGSGGWQALPALYIRQLPFAVAPWVVIPGIMVLAPLRQRILRTYSIDILRWLEFEDTARSTALFVALTVTDVGLCWGLLQFGRRLWRHIPPARGVWATANTCVVGIYLCVTAWGTMFVLFIAVMLGYG